jgi:hypothetical protein
MVLLDRYRPSLDSWPRWRFWISVRLLILQMNVCSAFRGSTRIFLSVSILCEPRLSLFLSITLLPRLDQSPITGSIPAELGQLTALTHLDLGTLKCRWMLSASSLLTQSVSPLECWPSFPSHCVNNSHFV